MMRTRESSPARWENWYLEIAPVKARAVELPHTLAGVEPATLQR